MRPLAPPSLSSPAAHSREAIELFLDAIADAIADRLEHRESTKQRLLNAEQAAEYLGIGETTVHKMVTEETLMTVHIGRRELFDIRDLDKFIERAKGRE